MDYLIKQPIIEIYECLQGEGKYIGVPSILIRTLGCPLRCQFGKTICDTAYSSWDAKNNKDKRYSLKDIFDFISYSKCQHIIVSGGSPTMHPKMLQEICLMGEILKKYITIETEGSKYVPTLANFISISPKLSNSKPILNKERGITLNHIKTHELLRINYSEMKKFIKDKNSDYQVKFVVSNIEKDLKEIKEVQKILEVPSHKIWLMPEGITKKQISEIAKTLVKICIDNNYNFSDRLHIRLYNNKRFK